MYNNVITIFYLIILPRPSGRGYLKTLSKCANFLPKQVKYAQFLESVFLFPKIKPYSLFSYRELMERIINYKTIFKAKGVFVMKKAITNETLLEKVQRERKERRFARAEVAMRKALPKEIEENDIKWSDIITFLISGVAAVIGFVAFMLITIFVVTYFMPL